MLDSNLNVSEKALQYEAGGASCLSVLTEKDYFNGSIDDLLVAKKSANYLLRKDFIIDPLQVYANDVREIVFFLLPLPYHTNYLKNYIH